MNIALKYLSFQILFVACTLLLTFETIFTQPVQSRELRMPEIIAHRGASYLAPENTMASVRLAWAMDVDAVEFDVFLTADNEIVVFHDRNTKRITGRDRPVEEQTLDELRELDYGAWKAPQWEGEPIPTLDEVLATLPGGKRMFVDVKSDTRIVKPMLEAFDRSGHHAHQLVVIAFSYELAAKTKQLRPHIPVFWLVSFRQDEETGEWLPGMEEVIRKARQAHVDGINVNGNREPARNPANIAKVRESGLGYYVWTINHIDDAQEFLEWGVDGITTDRPAWLKKQLLSRNGCRLLKDID